MEDNEEIRNEILKNKDIIVRGDRFKDVTIYAKTLDELYFLAIKATLAFGRKYKIDSGSYAGSHRFEFDNAKLIVEYPTTRPLAPTPREGIPVPTNDEKIELYYNNYLMNGYLEPNEHYRYSSWIVGMPEDIPLKELTEESIPRGTRFNQLQWCIDHFIKDGFGTNHCYIRVGCAEGLKRYDWPYKSDAEKGSTECMTGLSLKIKKSDDNQYYLNGKVTFRSWDMIDGMPENLGGIVRLLEETAGEIEKKSKKLVKIGTLFADSDGLHVYDHFLDYAKLYTNTT
jgi:thymidylate synthase